LRRNTSLLLFPASVRKTGDLNSRYLKHYRAAAPCVKSKLRTPKLRTLALDSAPTGEIRL